MRVSIAMRSVISRIVPVFAFFSPSHPILRPALIFIYCSFSLLPFIVDSANGCLIGLTHAIYIGNLSAEEGMPQSSPLLREELI